MFSNNGILICSCGVKNSEKAVVKFGGSENRE